MSQTPASMRPIAPPPSVKSGVRMIFRFTSATGSFVATWAPPIAVRTGTRGAFTIAVGPRRSASAVHGGWSSACARVAHAASTVTRRRIRMARVYSVIRARCERSHPEPYRRHAVRETLEYGRSHPGRDPGAQEKRGDDLQHETDQRCAAEEYPWRSLLEILDLDDLREPLRFDAGRGGV